MRLKSKFLVALVFTAVVVLAGGDAAKTRELLAQLQPSSPLAERARACQQLAIVGTTDAVPALAALLGDAQLGHYAREALEAMAAPESDAALRAALLRLEGPPLIGAINSLGARGDTAAVPALATIAAAADESSAGAALQALARIGTPDALAPVRAALGKNPVAAEALLVPADRLRAKGRDAEAVELFDEVRASRAAGALMPATRGAILARGAAGVPLLVETLRSRDAALRSVALQAMRELPGESVTSALVAELDRLPAEVQPAVLAALVDRGGPTVVTAVEKRAVAGDDAALTALGRIGRASSVPLLLRALPTSETAQRSLVLIPVREADPLVLGALATATDRTTRGKLIAVLGARGVAAATPELLKLAQGVDAETRRAALRALAATTQPRDLPALIGLSAASEDDATRTLADRAIYSAAMKIPEPGRRVDPLLAAVRAAKTPAERAALFRPLGAVVRAVGGSSAALATVRESTRDSDGVVRAAAVRCLADWPDATPAMELLVLARTETEPTRGLALAGAVRLATNVAAGRDKAVLDALDLLTSANALVASDAERLMIVSAFGNLRRVEALRLLEPYLQHEAVKTEAALAVVQIAPALLGGANAAAVRSTLEQIAATERDADVRARAAGLLKGGAPTKKAGKKKQ